MYKGFDVYKRKITSFYVLRNFRCMHTLAPIQMAVTILSFITNQIQTKSFLNNQSCGDSLNITTYFDENLCFNEKNKHTYNTDGMKVYKNFLKNYLGTQIEKLILQMKSFHSFL